MLLIASLYLVEVIRGREKYTLREREREREREEMITNIVQSLVTLIVVYI